MLHRAVARLTRFEKAEDYEALERVLAEAHERKPLPMLAYVVMPHHWHFVVRAQTDEQLSHFFRWLTHTHSMRWHAHDGTGGTGQLDQGRFKTFPVEQDEHLYAVLRYVEPNPLRAGLCERGKEWRCGSANRYYGGQADRKTLLAGSPLPDRGGGAHTSISPDAGRFWRPSGRASAAAGPMAARAGPAHRPPG